MGDNDDKMLESAPVSGESEVVDSPIQQEVQEITEAVSGVVRESSLSDKVEELRTYIDNISEDVRNWRSSRADTYVEALETLKSQVDEIQNEWDTVSAGMKAQRERLESVLQSFPGIIETSTLRALALRVSHLEKLVSNLVEESNIKSSAAGTRRQFIISLIALGVTVILWGVWIVLSLIN